MSCGGWKHLDLGELFQVPSHLRALAASYRFSGSFVSDFYAVTQSLLSGMVCFYGLHYIAFFPSFGLKAWLLFDDRNIKVAFISFVLCQLSSCVGNEHGNPFVCVVPVFPFVESWPLE
jgi:hypothetical protein